MPATKRFVETRANERAAIAAEQAVHAGLAAVTEAREFDDSGCMEAMAARGEIEGRLRKQATAMRLQRTCG